METFTPSQAWFTSTAGEALDYLGNWRVLVTDKDGDGPDGGAPDVVQTREHNDANELTAVDPDGAGSQDPLPITCDKNGNMRERKLSTASNGTAYRYTHDAWNRLMAAQTLTAMG